VADRHAPPHASTRADGLERLLETEQLLEARLVEAAAEAGGLRRDAERRAAELAEHDGTEAEREVGELAARIAAERDAACAVARDEAGRMRARYADLELDSERLDAAADELLRALRADEAGGR
jgi:hypothetical protein